MYSPSEFQSHFRLYTHGIQLNQSLKNARNNNISCKFSYVPDLVEHGYINNTLKSGVK